MKKEIPRDYGKCEAFPRMPDVSLPKIETYPYMIKMQTMYEGPLTYMRFWNFWVRAATVATDPSDFFRNYESGAPEVWTLINDVGAPIRNSQKEEDIWNKISTIWNWLQHNVTEDSAAYGTLIALSGGGGLQSTFTHSTMCNITSLYGTPVFRKHICSQPCWGVSYIAGTS